MTNITPFRKTVAGALAALMLATSVVALSSSTASAQWRHGGGWGPGVAAGVIGGLAAGALAAGAAGAYGPAYYYGPGPYYYGPGPYSYPDDGCYFAPQRLWNGYRWVVRRVEVCE